MRPGARHGVIVGAGEVPLAVLDKEMPGEEEQRQRQKREERVIRESVDAAKDIAVVPRVREDLHVEGEWNAERGEQNVADREVEEQVIAGGASALRAERSDHEELVAEDGDHVGDDVEGDPAPPVLLVEHVSGPLALGHHRRSGVHVAAL